MVSFQFPRIVLSQTKAQHVAQALASPVRLETILYIYLPKYFLLRFQLLIHPLTKGIWLLPELPVAVNTPSSKQKPSQAPPTNPKSSTGSQIATLPVSTKYGLANQTFMRRITVKKKGKVPYGNLIARQSGDGESVVNKTEVVWRQDMDSFILKALQKQALHDLLYLSKKAHMYLRPVRKIDYDVGVGETWNKHQASSKIGAFLWLGHGKNGTDLNTQVARLNGKDPDDPGALEVPGFVRTDVTFGYMRDVPVYDLTKLLSPADVLTLRAKLKDGEVEDLFCISVKTMTVQAQMNLWKLVGYLNL
jgi:hypothetical protein